MKTRAENFELELHGMSSAQVDGTNFNQVYSMSSAQPCSINLLDNNRTLIFHLVS